MLASVKRLLGFAALLVVVIFGLSMLASESGEVVVLRTFTGEDPHETRVWIVDDRGVSWLRSGSPGAGWYQRLRENPAIEVERDGEVHAYQAFPVEGGPSVDHVNMLMFQKYGWADAMTPGTTRARPDPPRRGRRGCAPTRASRSPRPRRR